MSFFPQNFSILSDWQSTLTVAFSQLRRTFFATEDTFQFREFNPEVNWGKMTISAVRIYPAKYCVVNKFLFFSFSASAVLAAPFTNEVTILLPRNASTTVELTQSFSSGCKIVNAGVQEVGVWIIGSGNNILSFRRGAAGNYTGGNFSVVANGFIEIA